MIPPATDECEDEAPERPYVCPECNGAFETLPQLVAHQTHKNGYRHPPGIVTVTSTHLPTANTTVMAHQMMCAFPKDRSLGRRPSFEVRPPRRARSARRTEPRTTAPDDRTRQREQTTRPNARGANTPNTTGPHRRPTNQGARKHSPRLQSNTQAELSIPLCAFCGTIACRTSQGTDPTALMRERTCRVLSGSLDGNWSSRSPLARRKVFCAGQRTPEPKRPRDNRCHEDCGKAWHVTSAITIGRSVRSFVVNVSPRDQEEFPGHSQVYDGETQAIGERRLTSHTMPHFVPDPDDAALNLRG